MATPPGHPSTINPEPTPQPPHIIPSDEESISSQTYLPPSIKIDCLHQPSTKITPNDPSDATLHKNSVEPLSIWNLNLFHRDSRNLPPIPPFSTPAPCKNRTHFEYLNIHRIFVCRRFRNRNNLTTSTNKNMVNLVLIPSTIGSFATIANPPKKTPSRSDTSNYTESIWKSSLVTVSPYGVIDTP